MDNRQQVHDWNEEFFIYLKIAKERHLLSNFDTNLKMQISSWKIPNFWGTQSQISYPDIGPVL